MTMLGRLLRSQSGQVVSMMPIILMVILLLFGGTYDILRYIVFRHNVQSAADAASLAGASDVDVIEYNSQGQYIGPTVQIDQAQAYTEAAAVFQANLNLVGMPGSTGVSINPTFQATSPTQYTVAAQVNIPTVFLSILKFFGTGPPVIHANVVSESRVSP